MIVSGATLNSTPEFLGLIKLGCGRNSTIYYGDSEEMNSENNGPALQGIIKYPAL